MVLYPNKLPESERVCSGICNLLMQASVKVLYFMYQEQLNGYPIVKLLKDLYDIISYLIE